MQSCGQPHLTFIMISKTILCSDSWRQLDSHVLLELFMIIRYQQMQVRNLQHIALRKVESCRGVEGKTQGSGTQLSAKADHFVHIKNVEICIAGKIFL